jgi:RNA polymerase sigma factor (sigma-70 family)
MRFRTDEGEAKKAATRERPIRYTTDQALYDSVKKLQAKLKPGERSLLIKQFAASLDRYETLALTLYPVRKHLYALYTTRVVERLATSTLSKHFNMSIRGHNKNVGATVDGWFKIAFDQERAGDITGAARALKHVGLRHEVIYSKEIEALVRSAGLEDALVELARTKQYRDILWRSCLRMAVRLAKKHAAPLSGEVIEEADLVQEAIIAAKEGVNNYEPTEEGRTFTSFMYNWVGGTLSKYINERTRTVALPRTTIDRFRPVRRAIEELGDTDNIHLLTTKANEFLVQAHGPRVVHYTPEEVATLMLWTQEAASLTAEVSVDESGHPNTLADLITDEDEPTTDAQLDHHYAMPRLLSVIRDYTSPEEYLLMELRWGSGKVKGLKAVADEYRAASQLPMNKGRVAEMENRVLRRLKRAIRNGDERLMEILRSMGDI